MAAYGREDETKDEAQPGAALAPNPDQVNEFHRYDDSDNSPESHHHTLGVDPNQASPGDHNHDGRNSFLISETGVAAFAARCARLYKNATQALANASYVTITWTAATLDTHSHFNGASPSRLTAQQAGYYRVSALIRWENTATGTYRAIRLMRNGVEYISHWLQAQSVVAPLPTNTITTVMQLNVGDYVEVQGYQDSGGALSPYTGGLTSANDFSFEYLGS